MNFKILKHKHTMKIKKLIYTFLITITLLIIIISFENQEGNSLEIIKMLKIHKGNN